MTAGAANGLTRAGASSFARVLASPPPPSHRSASPCALLHPADISRPAGGELPKDGSDRRCSARVGPGVRACKARGPSGRSLQIGQMVRHHLVDAAPCAVKKSPGMSRGFARCEHGEGGMGCAAGISSIPGERTRSRCAPAYGMKARIPRRVAAARFARKGKKRRVFASWRRRANPSR